MPEPEQIRELVEAFIFLSVILHAFLFLLLLQLLAGSTVKRKPGTVTSDVKNKPPTLLTVS